VREHRRVVGAYDLPVSLPAGIDADEIVVLFGRDKKAIGGVTFILDGPDGVEPVRDVPREAIDTALERLVRQ
jgi:5-deoxy-5-amino-3-dehydroquinate synthase